MSKVLIPVPSSGFDPSEVAIPWKLLRQERHEVVFATLDGQKASPDTCMLTGEGLGIWRYVLAARKDAADACMQMDSDSAFRNPLKYSELAEADFDAILLPGGHDKKVKEYLESTLLQQLVAEFFAAQKPVAAICHGVVLVARSKNRETEKSVIHNYKTTALLKSQERLGYNMTRLWMQDYYLTYPDKTVEEEVRTALSDENNFLKGPKPILRDSPEKLGRGFVVKDRNYMSARWPGDVYNLSLAFMGML